MAHLALRLREGDTERTLAGLRALPDQMRATGGAELLLGQALLETGDPAGAMAALDRAVTALPGRAEAHAAHGDAAEAAGEPTVAADAYGRAVECEPDNLTYRLLEVTGWPEGRDPETLIDLGAVYLSFEPPRVEDAVASYEEALKLDPANGDAAPGVALSYLRRPRRPGRGVHAQAASRLVRLVQDRARRLIASGLPGSTAPHLNSDVQFVTT